MLPDPKKLADVLRETILKSPKEKKLEKEKQRDQQITNTRNKLTTHINRQSQMISKLTEIAKKALSLNDEERFKMVGRQILWTQKDIARWERYMITYDLMEVKRTQARSSIDMILSLKEMADSLISSSSQVDVDKLQTQLDLSLKSFSNMDEKLEKMMGAIDTNLQSGMDVDSEELKTLEADLMTEVISEESHAFDKQINEKLLELGNDMENSKK